MEVFRTVVVLQALVCCEALQNFTTLKPTDREERGEEIQLFVTQGFRPCSWTMTSPGENGSWPVFRKPLQPLAAAVCESLGCGKVYQLMEKSADPNSTCLTGCSVRNSSVISCSRAAAADCSVVSEVICDALYVTPGSRHCVWTLRSPKAELSVTLSEEAVQRLPAEICLSLGCGKAFHQKTIRAPANSTCLTDCTYDSSRLRNCSSVISSNCLVLSEIICGNSQVRLAGGSYRCDGRVELWREGQWGTVCDDGWDKQDADVVCAQLGCGSSTSVLVQGRPYGQGTGPILRDELNCTGEESSLWECPAVMGDHDCGHKEDAGVVCSEYSLRLTGGRDRCSGRVEVYREGAWGTVCDDPWDKDSAALACSMLNCGDAGHFTGLKERFTHINGTLWYYSCSKTDTILWNCEEMQIPAASHICDNKAAGVICTKSIEFLVPSTTKATTPVLTTVEMTTPTPKSPWSLELLGCISLSSALLIALIMNFILCCCAKKRKAHTVQQQYPNLQNTAEPEENNYRDSVHLVKVTNNDHTSNAQRIPPPMWTQSSIESGSYDTDYEPSDSGPDSSFPLSTFRNSMRYSAEGRTPGLHNTNLQSVTEEDSGGPGDAAVMRGYQQPYVPNGAFQGVAAAPSEDSFETSSTSSGECYENTVPCNAENYENTEENRSDLQTGMKPPHPVLTNHITENFLNQTEDDSQGLVRKLSSGEDSPIYSPVSADMDLYSPVSTRTDPYSSDSDYDDVAYIHRADQ
ncbi:antigen WC1.1-like [Astyanax mexicanus]|uniref:Antigen WC1.1-like n=1 Tax=Astyanax mexicanus TaxID=7994 RepID=A0A8B9H8E6_ASTMX|nr:antigen WC1.1-like [Astyanax mexicanus]